MTERTPDVHIPRSFGTIERPRLLNKLKAVINHRLTIISAPPGYGKTTIAAQFARQCAYPVAWCTLEQSGRDAPNVHAQLTAALEAIAPGIREMAFPYGAASAELAAQTAHYLRRVLTKPVVIVIDDVHHLMGAPAAETWLRTLATALPPLCHLLLLSRTLPDLPIVEMIARREVFAIGPVDLCFTEDEVERLAQDIKGSALDPDDVRALTARLEGWPAGIVLALQPLPSEFETVLPGAGGPEALFEALATSILEAQPPGLRDFLLASSTLVRINPELCDAALGLVDSASWLNEAQERGLFMAKSAGGVVYHGLFREFLQRQLRRVKPELFTELHLNAAHWFEERHQVDAAVDHYLAAGAQQQAAALAERVAASYFAQGKIETLLNWQRRLTAVASPRLILTCAQIYTDRYQYVEAEEALHQARTMFGAHPLDVASVDIVQGMADLQRGRYEEAIQAMTVVMTANADLPINLKARALTVRGFSTLRLGDVASGVRDLEDAVPLYREDGDSYALSQALQNLEVAYLQLGRLDDASECLHQVVGLRRVLKADGPLALALNNLGYHYYLRSDYRQASATLEEGLGIAARALDRRAETYLLWSLGDVYRDQADSDKAIKVYDRALELVGTNDPALRCSLLISASALRRWQGQHLRALALAEEATLLADTHALAVERAFARVMKWGAAAQLGQLQEALIQLPVEIEELSRRSATFELMRALAIEAHLHLLDNEPASARASLEGALNVGAKVGSRQPIAAEAFHAKPLRALIERYSPLLNAVGAELKALDAARAKPEVYLRDTRTTYSLRVYTFGPERLERDGKAVPSNVWRALAARDLFMTLLFVGAQTREDIGLAMWPDSSPKQMRQNIHTAIYRARSALGENVITHQDGLYFVSADLDLWCDAKEFDQLVGQARYLPTRDARAEDLWRRAVDLYRGDFLPMLETDWADALRESYRERFIEALMRLSDCVRARGDLWQAVSLLKQALAVDPYREDIHRAILTCYGQKGEKRKVATHLKELQQLFLRELSIQPSSETLALARSLLN